MLETTTEFPSVNIFKRINNKDSTETQQAKPPINQMVRLQKQEATTFWNISVELVPLENLIHVHPLVKIMVLEELKQNVPLEGKDFPFRPTLRKAHKRSGNFRNSTKFSC